MVCGKAEFSIESAQATDIPAIIALERDDPQVAHWSGENYRSLFDPKGASRIALVAKGANQANVMGFLIARVAEPECELENLLVASDWRRHGVGRELIERFVGLARERNVSKIFLEVRESNASARMFYENSGFVKSGSRRSYYARPPEDALLYTLQL